MQPPPLSNLKTFSSFRKRNLTALKKLPISLFPQPLADLICYLSLCICVFWAFHIHGIIKYVVSFDRLFSHVFKLHLSCNMYPYLIYFYCQIIFHCIDASHFVYLFISQWKFGLLTVFVVVVVIIMSNSHKYLYTSDCMDVRFYFCWEYT